MNMLEGETTARFVIRVEQARRAVKASGVATLHAFMHRLDASVRMLLDNVRVNKRASGRGPVTWEDVVAICRDSLAGVSIANVPSTMPTAV